MRPQSLQSREQRILAVGLLGMLLLILVFGMVVPMFDRYHHYRQALDDLEFRSERLSGLAASKPGLSAHAQGLANVMQSSGLTIERETPALAAADMQRLVGEVIAAQGGEVRSVQMVPAVQEAGFVRVAIRVQMNGNSQVLASVFEQLESSEPLVFVDDVRIQGRAFGSGGRGGDEPQQERIDVRFDLIVFMRARERGAE